MKALVLFSGGVDSSTCLGMAVSRYGAENVVALSVQYGQKHEKEVEAAEKIARYYNVELVRLDLTPIFAFSDCPLLKQSEQEIPRESYAEQIAATAGRYLLMCLSETDCFCLPQPACLCQRAAV